MAHLVANSIGLPRQLQHFSSTTQMAAGSNAGGLSAPDLESAFPDQVNAQTLTELGFLAGPKYNRVVSQYISRRLEEFGFNTIAKLHELLSDQDPSAQEATIKQIIDGSSSAGNTFGCDYACTPHLCQ